MWIFCCGMGGSGSTVQYLLTKEIVEHYGGRALGFCHPRSFDALFQQHDGTAPLLVVKTHAFPPAAATLFAQGAAQAIYIYRDLRDTIATHIRKNPQHDFNQLAHIVHLLLKRRTQYNSWKQVEPRLVSRYETMIQDQTTEALRISRFLKLDITEPFAAEIAQKYSLDAQRERIAAFDFQQHGVNRGFGRYYDPVTQLHKSHIGTGQAGAFKTALKPVQIALIEALASTWLTAHNYPLTQRWYLQRCSLLVLAWQKLRDRFARKRS